MPDDALTMRSPFDGLARAALAGRGVIFADRSTLAIARIACPAGHAQQLCVRVRESFGIELPREPRCVRGREHSFIAVSVDTWLVAAEEAPIRLMDSLRGFLAGCAMITDQSSGFAVLRLSGARVRAALAKVLPIDLHPRAFPIGCAASTAAGHIAVTLWRCADERDNAVFELAIPRSFAESFWHAIASAAAEFGFAPG